MPVIANDIPDDPIAWDVCDSFSAGQNSFTRSSLLEGNEAAILDNLVIQINGEVRKRAGTRNIYAGTVSGPGVQIQNLVYYDTTTVERLVAIANGQAHFFNGTDWDAYFTAGISDVNELIDIVQMTDDLYWTDSNRANIRKFDGAAVSDLAGSPSGTILEVVALQLAVAGIPSVPDAVDFSGVLDDSLWDIATQRLRIGDGSGEPVVALRRWQKQALVVFLRRGVYLINADPESDPADFEIQRIHNSIGIVGRRTAHQVGQDMWFLSRNGVMSVQKQMGTSDNLIAVPMSQRVQDVVKKIRWDHAHKSSAACYNNFYLLQVPVNSNNPDTTIVYHYLTGGFATFSNLAATVFLEQPFEGTTRLVMGCDTGEVREWLDYLRDDQINTLRDYHDGIDLGPTLILPLTLPVTLPSGINTVSTLVTRSLVFGEPLATKSGYYARIEFTQNDGTVYVYVILDGGEPIFMRSYDLATAFTTLPATFPVTLAPLGGWLKRKIPLHHLNRFTELQFKIVSDAGEFRLRRIVAEAFVNPVSGG